MDLLKPENPEEWDRNHADELRETERILAGPGIKWGLVILNERMD